MQDTIEKTVDLNAPIARVWLALTDHTQFGQWFGVALDGPFAVGEVTTGRITAPGCEHYKWQATVQSMDHERHFSFTWHPNAVVPEVDFSKEPTNLVEFTLEATATGTRLQIVESGFATLPLGPGGRDAFRENSKGWEGQVQNIKKHVER